VLRGIDLTIGRGEVVAVVGPSGTGKSTLLKHVVGLVLPDRGDVRVAGRSVPSARGRELAALRGRMGYAFQDGALLDSLTVRQNLRLALDDAACARDPRLALRRTGEALERVHLGPEVLDKLPDELSGGMRKRVGVARAILNRPEVLLLDEPTSGLDPRNAEAVRDLVMADRARRGATTLMVTHDLATLPGLADRVVLLLGGRVHLDASPEHFFACPDPRVRSFIGTATGP
ncbi:MAG: ATP-binding cassette domain-containing protein, partial [Gemmatimonadetes bacterium]|nr:ATP-binding cassette domain-containing protein [Gemmatimonadota bacterium]NIQ52003.1 ATP-binding cassette domain-containing protein [Gemmatimonadota bacterium]NIU72103.1 ATP-binding cassette domain-containing protein [Gammaproteobacteria bacterium]NIX42666.1 ATP-binding cassette domain-containing protein [Gemmatimonadota bacterium]NIY06827.1 ATP-binding cassette domain-containing protein [Gemmatimonadota bacterium]